ncbi:MAG: TIGR04255 family protein [Armatimonadetes bacterium]|nr:TIGR04255 family protein [Armatimonadota bacterium]MDE2205835.1 TIGR04255 family protein [Armatimonadota bacterium]
MMVQFSNLPLQEVSLRAAFKQRKELAFSDYASFWKRLPEEFDKSAEADVVEGSLPQPAQMPLAGRLCGVTFRRKNAELVLLSTSISSRWLNAWHVPYPRFPELRGVLELGCQELSAVLGTGALEIGIVNITYANLIIPPQSSDPTQEALRYFQPGVVPHMAADKPLHALSLDWHESEGHDFRITLQEWPTQVPLLQEDGSSAMVDRPAFVITTTAGTLVGGGGSQWSDLARMHDVIQPFFLSLLSERALEEWGYARNN